MEKGTGKKKKKSNIPSGGKQEFPTIVGITHEMAVHPQIPTGSTLPVKGVTSHSQPKKTLKLDTWVSKFHSHLLGDVKDVSGFQLEFIVIDWLVLEQHFALFLPRLCRTRQVKWSVLLPVSILGFSCLHSKGTVCTGSTQVAWLV